MKICRKNIFIICIKLSDTIFRNKISTNKHDVIIFPLKILKNGNSVIKESYIFFYFFQFDIGLGLCKESSHKKIKYNRK